METLSDYIYDLTKESKDELVEICCYETQKIKNLLTTEKLELDAKCLSFTAPMNSLPENLDFSAEEPYVEVDADLFVELFDLLNANNHIVEFSYNPLPSIFNLKAEADTVEECVEKISQNLQQLQEDYPDRTLTLELEYYSRASFPDIEEEQQLISLFAEKKISLKITAVSKKSNLPTQYALNGVAQLAFPVI